ncbi:MAG: SH3 domain-containing protein [Oscillospiraceae bacterium]|nr:SH3 domain-containing protein [Oscillospiraceae bacterium]
MKVKVVRPCRWDHPGDFPTFKKGTPVILDKDEDDDFLGWHACGIAGYKTYVPIVFVRNGKLVCDYNPTELIPQVGEVLEVVAIFNAWLIAKNEQGLTGWIPAECVISV